MGEIVGIKRKPRPLRKQYSKTQPYVLERHDEEDGSISYEIWDKRPDRYRRVCSVYEGPVDDDVEPVDRGQAKRDAELIVDALNLHHAYFPSQSRP